MEETELLNFLETKNLKEIQENFPFLFQTGKIIAKKIKG